MSQPQPPGPPGQPKGPGYGYPQAQAPTQPAFPAAGQQPGPPPPPPGPAQPGPPPGPSGPGPAGPAPGYGYPHQPPPAGPGPGYGYPQGPAMPGPGMPGAGMPGPFPPPPPRRGNAGAAVALAFGVAVVLLFLYGLVTGMVVDFESLLEDAVESGDTEIDVAQLTWLAPLLGALVGLPVARLAPGQVGLYWVAGLAAVVTMLLGETFATAVLASEATDGAKGSLEIFFEDFSDAWEGWAENSHGMTWPLMALAPAAAVFTGYFLGGANRPGAPLPQPMPYR